MKYSYTLLKKLVPVIKSKKDLLKKLNQYVFEAEDLEPARHASPARREVVFGGQGDAGGGDGIEIALSPNRFSSAGHWGLAQEISAVYGSKFSHSEHSEKSLRSFRRLKLASGRPRVDFQISVKTDLCRRIMGQYFENIEIKSSPKWMQSILETCGFRPINNIVDITNYVMLETGQPLHAFDYDRLDGAHLIVRPAELIEELTTLDGQKFKLDPSILVIADEKDPLDIAGIKGGKKAEIKDRTGKIILTCANFDGPTIYRASRKLNLITDASSRNAHNLTPALVEVAVARAAELIEELANGERGRIIDVYLKKAPKRVVKFDIEKFNQLSGLNLKAGQAFDYLKRLGFKPNGAKIEAPFFRDDIERFEDLAEEVIRLYGLNNLPAVPPHVSLRPSGYEDQVILKDKIRKVLTGFGLSEVYNYSFVSKASLENNSAGEFLGMKSELVTNPLSAEFEYLRTSLAPYLLKNIEDNFRFFNQVRVFEIGHIFSPEKIMLGLAIGDKKEVSIFEMKGLVDELLEQLGLVDRHYSDLNFEIPFLSQRESLRIESDHCVIGYIGSVRGSGARQSIAEIDLDKLLKLVEGEKEYRPLSKFPSIMRDISLLVTRDIRVDKIMELIEIAAPKYLDDVDLVDFYEDEKLGENMKSLTFRLVFLAEDRTLTDEEVDKEMQKISSILIKDLGVEIR